MLLPVFPPPFRRDKALPKSIRTTRMNPYLVFILAAIVISFLLEAVSDYLNVKHAAEELPAEFRELYGAEKYRKSQAYLKERSRFGVVFSAFQTLVLSSMILGGGFNIVDSIVRALRWGPIPTGLAFFAVVALAWGALSLPFSVYATFVIEERYGFNRTTVKTFLVDILKGLLLTASIGAPVLAAVLWFFETSGSLAWLYCWMALTGFQIFMLFIAPVFIMPLFNEFEPLEEGELRSEIERFSEEQRFEMKGVFKMDGSKRSSKSNAFFTGFGSSRRIVLFDTLIEKHSVAELVSILAHEMGHYKKGHITKMIAWSTLQFGAVCYLLSLFINNRRLFDAFSMDHLSIHASLLFFLFLYHPIDLVLSVITQAISRKHEYEADRYAVETRGVPEVIIDALKKLSVDNLSNLTPHPFKVFLAYSHPPILERIAAIRRYGGGS
jgi:STE24 endopeptidase